MAFFADLSRYQYALRGDVFAREVDWVLNVGWLSRNEAFAHGSADDMALERLLAGLQSVGALVHPMYGVHICDLCGRARGNGEIWYVDGDTTYAAPALIGHYIKEHGYAPPGVFWDAVRYGVIETKPVAPAALLSFVIDGEHAVAGLIDGRTLRVPLSALSLPAPVTQVRVNPLGAFVLCGAAYAAVPITDLCAAVGERVFVRRPPTPPPHAPPPLPRPITSRA